MTRNFYCFQTSYGAGSGGTQHSESIALTSNTLQGYSPSALPITQLHHGSIISQSIKPATHRPLGITYSPTTSVLSPECFASKHMSLVFWIIFQRMLSSHPRQLIALQHRGPSYRESGRDVYVQGWGCTSGSTLYMCIHYLSIRFVLRKPAEENDNILELLLLNQKHSHLLLEIKHKVELL